MTMPSERSRSVVQTREFLVELSRNKELPESVRDQARFLLRHFPKKDDVVKVVKELTGGYGADVYIEATGNPKSVEQGETLPPALLPAAERLLCSLICLQACI